MFEADISVADNTNSLLLCNESVRSNCQAPSARTVPVPYTKLNPWASAVDLLFNRLRMNYWLKSRL
jgi:hypothetical protein